VIKLTIRTELGSPQRAFEVAAVEHMKLSPGLFSISANGKRYLNGNVQWLWVQYQKAWGQQ
jgi:hypothetical protein